MRPGAADRDIALSGGRPRTRREPRRTISFLLAASTLWFGPPLYAEPAFSNCSHGADADRIVAQRERFNAAIRDEDIDTINEILVDDVVLITGTDSDIYAGSVRQLALWARDFESDERLVYTRTPSCIDVSAGFPIALEHGQWRGEPIDGRPGHARGRYTAKWRNDGTIWRIEVETYMTVECTPPVCPRSENSE
ncbi:nuclear transport factor 2 family protein [Halomonas denitrificans]|nr:nuclear transport factor 2 family protein [Halomonas denitrificans]